MEIKKTAEKEDGLEQLEDMWDNEDLEKNVETTMYDINEGCDESDSVFYNVANGLTVSPSQTATVGMYSYLSNLHSLTKKDVKISDDVEVVFEDDFRISGRDLKICLKYLLKLTRHDEPDQFV